MISDVGNAVLASFARRHNNLFGITVHNQIRIVCYQYDLPTRFRLLEVSRQKVVHRFIVQVLVRLIHDQRAGIANIHTEVKNQKHDSFCTRRQFLKFHTVVFQSVAQADVINLVEPSKNILNRYTRS